MFSVSNELYVCRGYSIPIHVLYHSQFSYKNLRIVIFYTYVCTYAYKTLVVFFVSTCRVRGRLKTSAVLWVPAPGCNTTLNWIFQFLLHLCWYNSHHESLQRAKPKEQIGPKSPLRPCSRSYQLKSNSMTSDIYRLNFECLFISRNLI